MYAKRTNCKPSVWKGPFAKMKILDGGQRNTLIGVLHEALVDYNQHIDDATKVICIMIATKIPKIQKIYKDYWPYEMNKSLSKIFIKKAIQKSYEVVNALMVCTLKDVESVCAHTQKM